MFDFFKHRKDEEGVPPPEQEYPAPVEMPAHIREHIEHLRAERRFPISEADYAVMVHMLIRFTTDGVYAPDDICRRLVMARLKWRADRTFGGGGLYVHTPPPGKLPFFTCMVCMEREPMDEKCDWSRLVICWFQDELPRNIYATIGERVYGIDWRAYAEDCKH